MEGDEQPIAFNGASISSCFFTGFASRTSSVDADRGPNCRFLLGVVASFAGDYTSFGLSEPYFNAGYMAMY